MFIAYALLSTKKQTNALIHQIRCFLVNQEKIRNLKIDWAINSIDDCRVVLRVVGLGQLIWNLAVDSDMFMKHMEQTVVINKEYKTVY